MEEWRRTDMRAFSLDHFTPPSQSENLPIPTGAFTERFTAAARLVTCDGNIVSKTGSDSDSPAFFGSIIEAANAGLQGFDIEKTLDAIVDYRYDKFSSLHAAFRSADACLFVPSGTRIAEPFHLLRSLSAGKSDFGHVLVVLQDGAEATLVTETASLDSESTDAALHCGAVEIVVGRGAKLRFVDFQNWNRGVWHFSHQRAVLHEDAEIEWTVGALGARLAKVNQHVVLAGPHGRAAVNGVMFTEDRQHHAYHTLQHHQAPHCESDLLYKGALQDRSHMVWRGMIRVDPGAIKTDGYQRNDNLILSETARADCIPGLEIEADDVRCTHGATAGRVDDSEIFYLQTRGLTRREAARMIVTGFFQQVFDRVSIDSVREELERVIRRRVREYR
ncbi:Fe-S cluster assembly protein SufD [Thermostilla marina]